MSRKLAVFRCDASPSIGSGHVVRCLVLANALAGRGWRVLFACRPPTLETVPALAAVDRLALPEEMPLSAEPGFLGSRIERAELLVVDHYGWQAALEEDSRSWAARILVLDDPGDREHDADLLLNPNLGWSEEAYRGRVPASCRLLLGPRYAPLHPAFRNARRDSRMRARVGRLLVAMGGTDPGDATGAAVSTIAASGFDGVTEIVLGPAAPHLERVRARVADRPRFRLHVGLAPDRMAQLLARCDVAVAAGGSSAWERCCVGLPSVVAVIAANQRVATRALADQGAALSIGNPAHREGRSELREALSRLLPDEDLRRRFRDRGRSLVDGLGTERVMHAVDRMEAARHATG